MYNFLSSKKYLIIGAIILTPIVLYGNSIYSNIKKENAVKNSVILENSPRQYETADFAVEFPCSDIYSTDSKDYLPQTDFVTLSYRCVKKYPDKKYYEDYIQGTYEIKVTTYVNPEYGTAETEAKKCEDTTVEYPSERPTAFIKNYREVRATEGRGIYYLCGLSIKGSSENLIYARRYINNKLYEVSLLSNDNDRLPNFEAFFKSFSVKVNL